MIAVDSNMASAVHARRCHGALPPRPPLLFQPLLRLFPDCLDDVSAAPDAAGDFRQVVDILTAEIREPFPA